MTDAFDHVIFRGRLMDKKTQAFLEAMEAELGYELTVAQGCYNAGGVAASAGTHDGGGVIDLAPWDWERKVKVARSLGAFAWHRPTLPGVWNEHIHLGIRNHGRLAPSAQRQQVDYDATPPRNGLANHAADPTWHPSPAVEFKYPAPAPKPIVKPQPTPRALKCATWNLRIGRSPGKVTDEVLQLLDEFDIDVLTVCEASGYVTALRKPLARHGYRLQAFLPKFGGSARDSAVIVRKGLRMRGKRLHRLESFGWRKGKGRPGLHWPRSAVSVAVEGVRFLAVHQAPGPFTGSFASRGTANVAGFATVTDLGRRWTARGRAWVMPGDWNRHMSDPVAQQFARGASATLLGGGIDWVASNGVTVTNVAEQKFGTSDHNPKTFTVTR